VYLLPLGFCGSRSRLRRILFLFCGVPGNSGGLDFCKAAAAHAEKYLDGAAGPAAFGGGSGFDLREVFLDAKDINKDELTEAAYMAALRTRGQEYINENKVFENFEAEAEADVNFTYQKDYDLGDVVTVKKKKWGTSQNLRITELCEVYEYGGMYVVPTFGDALPTAIKWDD